MINVRDTVKRFYSIEKWVTYPGNIMDTVHFIFDTNTMIQHIHVGDMWVEASYAMRLHKIEPRNSNHYM